MAKQLQLTVIIGTVFLNNDDGKLTFLQPEGLQNILWKNCHMVNCGLQISSHCKKNNGTSQKP